MSMFSEIAIDFTRKNAIIIVEEEFKKLEFQPLDNMTFQKLKHNIITRMNRELVD